MKNLIFIFVLISIFVAQVTSLEGLFGKFREKAGEIANKVKEDTRAVVEHVKSDAKFIADKINAKLGITSNSAANNKNEGDGNGGIVLNSTIETGLFGYVDHNNKNITSNRVANNKNEGDGNGGIVLNSTIETGLVGHIDDNNKNGVEEQNYIHINSNANQVVKPVQNKMNNDVLPEPTENKEKKEVLDKNRIYFTINESQNERETKDIQERLHILLKKQTENNLKQQNMNTHRTRNYADAQLGNKNDQLVSTGSASQTI